MHKKLELNKETLTFKELKRQKGKHIEESFSYS